MFKKDKDKDDKAAPKKEGGKGDAKSLTKSTGASKKPKKEGLFQKLANAKESVKIKFASAAGRPDSLDTSTNDAMISGAEAQSTDILNAYRLVSKGCKATVDRLEGQIKAATLVSQQFSSLTLDTQEEVLVMLEAAKELREKESACEALLMNECSNGILLSLDEYIAKRTTDLKSSHARYEHSLDDYGVAVRKAQVRLGKGPEQMNPSKYLKAAIQREIALQNYEKVTSEHLLEHRKVEDSKNLEIFITFLRAQEAQIKYLKTVTQLIEGLQSKAKNSFEWSKREREESVAKQKANMTQNALDEDRRLVDLHDDFVRLCANSNMFFLSTLFKMDISYGNDYNESAECIVALAFEFWGLNEVLLHELIVKYCQDENVPVFSNNRIAEQLLSGLIATQFPAWWEVCLKPLIEAVNALPLKYNPAKPEGMSAILTQLEELFDRLLSFGEFPALFQRIFQMESQGIMAGLMGSRVFKLGLCHPEKFGFAKLSEPVKNAMEVISFILWELLRGRKFVVMDAVRCAVMKISVTIAHYVSENVAMINNWALSSSVSAFRDHFVKIHKGSCAPVNPSMQDKVCAVKAGGAVNRLLLLVRPRADSVAANLFESEPKTFYRFCDAYNKAASGFNLLDSNVSDTGEDSGVQYEYEYKYIDSAVSSTIETENEEDEVGPLPSVKRANRLEPPPARKGRDSSGSLQVDALVSPRRPSASSEKDLTDSGSEILVAPRVAAPPRPPATRPTRAKSSDEAPRPPMPAQRPAKPVSGASSYSAGLTSDNSGEETPPLPPRRPIHKK